MRAVLSGVELLALRSGHAYRLAHLHHHARYPAYTLFNAGAGTDVADAKGRTMFSLYLAANNLFDVAYQSHLSRLKYEETNNATGRRGVYNLGRTLSVKVVVPLVFK
ncbi:hypothetical protein A0257_12720 [Hymenobacter psoromatis]|nr:hypothetical protein A0257_12720 [Hymenobacter psoromatis]